jgi:hypothetical protein
MAFDFLKSAGDIVSGAAGIASLFGSKGEPEASKQSSKALNEAIAMAKASADPNSAQFKNLVALEEQSLREAAVRQITDYLKQNQRNVARGGISGIVNPERRDEAVMQSLARAFQGAQMTARDSARQTLTNAAGALTGAGSSMQPIANIQNTIADQNINRRASLGQAIGDGLGSLGGVLNEWTQQSPVPKPGSTNIQLA